MKKADAQKLLNVLEYIAMLEKADFENAMYYFDFSAIEKEFKSALSNLDDLFSVDTLASIYKDLLNQN